MKVLKERIEEIITLIAEVANGNFDYEIDASETGDELDAIISGVSMLGQELKNSTVSRDFMQSIYQGVVDMLLILNTDYTIRNVNEAFEELLGYKEEELKGLPFSKLIQSCDTTAFLKVIERFKGQGKGLNEELTLRTKQKHTIPVSCSFSYLINNQKEVNGILIIAKDLTKIKQTEDELKKAKNKAEAANEAKSNFLSSMSHEIRTPLNGIMGFTDLLMETELSTTQAQYINLIKTSGSTLTRLLNDILDLHRIEQDKISLEMIPFKIRDTIITHLEPYKLVAEGKKLSFSYSFDASVPDVAIGDPTRINQVLINLISNAIKFTATGSINVHFQGEQAQEESIILKCTVTDTGIGIPAEKQAIIFESFTQSDQSTSRKYGGFGLGLAISKKLADLMQGELGIISPLSDTEKGSSFWFSVKLQQVKNEKLSQPTVPANPVFKLPPDTQILVVDDNVMNVMLIEKILTDMGAIVITAHNGKEGVQKALSGSFDLVFMDIQMPEMDGLQATALLRKSDFNEPIIAFSANAYKDDIHESVEAGMNDYLCKPFTRAELIALLKKWI